MDLTNIFYPSSKTSSCKLVAGSDAAFGENKNAVAFDKQV